MATIILIFRRENEDCKEGGDEWNSLEMNN